MHYPDSTKIEALKLWLITGNLRAVAAAMNIPHITLQGWRYSDWWAEMAADIRNEGQIQLTNRLKTIAQKAMDVTLDRLENGDWVLNQKTGKMERKPVVMRDAHRVAESFVDRATRIEAKPIDEVVEQKVQDRLVALAETFAKFSQRKREAVDATFVVKDDQTEQLASLEGGERAVQIESAAGVDVFQEARDGEEVGERDPQPEEVTQESSEEPLIDQIQELSTVQEHEVSPEEASSNPEIPPNLDGMRGL